MDTFILQLGFQANAEVLIVLPHVQRHTLIYPTSTS